MDLAADEFGINDYARRRFNGSLKDTLGSNGFIAPGKSGIWGTRLREAHHPQARAATVPPLQSKAWGAGRSARIVGAVSSRHAQMLEVGVRVLVQTPWTQGREIQSFHIHEPPANAVRRM